MKTIENFKIGDTVTTFFGQSDYKILSFEKIFIYKGKKKKKVIGRAILWDIKLQKEIICTTGHVTDCATKFILKY